MGVYGDFWGPSEGIDSKDYILLMDGDTEVSSPYRLLGHTLTNANVNLNDALQATRVRFRNGRIETVQITKRAAFELSRSYSIGIPTGALYSEVMRAIWNGCRKTFYTKYLCPTDSRFNHADIMPDAVLDPIQPDGDVITVDDTNLIQYTTTINTPEQIRLWAIEYGLVYTPGTSNQIHAVAFATEDCPTCADVAGFGLFAVGGNGTTSLDISTDDRFATTTAMTIAGATDYTTGVYTDGSLVVATFSDALDGAATAGGIEVSYDAGANFSAIAGLTTPLFDIGAVGSLLIAVGGTTSGGVVVQVSSDNGSSWTSVDPGIASDFAVAYAEDTENEMGYFVTDGGELHRITPSGSSVAYVDLTANLPGTPTLTDVAVLGAGHIMVVGDTGYAAESLDGGATFTELSFAGATDLTAVGGNRYRTIVGGAGGALYERTVMTDYRFTSITSVVGGTFTGAVTDIAMNVNDDFNRFAISGLDGKILILKPYYPNA